MTVEHSRGLLLATRVSRERANLAETLETSSVCVSLDPDLPASLLTTRVLLTTLRRGPGRLLLCRSGLSGKDVDGLVNSVQAVDPDRPLQVVDGAGNNATVQLHVGLTAGVGVRIVPEGYGAHIVGQPSLTIQPRRPGNALGAVYAAALGAGEAFKRTARVVSGRRVMHRHLQFCPFSLSSDLGAAPDLPDALQLDLGLIGVGAIGTGIVLVLDALAAEGRLLAVDYQRFASENRGTYSLGGAADVRLRPWKVDIAAAALPRFEVIPFRERVEDLIAAVDDGSVPWPRIVLTALDSAEARRAAQRLWPDHIIDAGTGDTMLGLHHCAHGTGRCLNCFFPVDREGPSAAAQLAGATGLSVERAMRGDDPLTQEDLEAISDDQRKVLLPHLGKPVCGLAQALGLTELEGAGYLPSIPFVSLQAACLAVGQLLALTLGARSQPNMVQYDALCGPQNAYCDVLAPRPGCICSERSRSIALTREARLGRAAGSS